MKRAKGSGICIATTASFVGMFAALLAGFLLVPMIVNILNNHSDWHAFAFAAWASAMVGALCVSNGKNPRSVQGPEAVCLTCLVWIVLVCLAALPFYFAESSRLSYVDSVFEAMSGLTTTGATVMTNLTEKSPGILLWRAMLNSMGGLGVITVGIFLLPSMKIDGLREIYAVEAVGRKLRFGVFKTVLYVTTAYIALTVLCSVSYKFAGMSVFDAICHALTTVSTGGFSNYDDSVRHFQSVKIEIIAMIFMLLGSCPLVAYLHLVMYRRFRSSQFLVYCCFVTICALISAAVLRHCFASGEGYFGTLRYAAFSIVSLSTSTGYSNCDYSNWPFVAVLGTVLTLCGGCAGSTNSGIKIYRLQVIISGIYEHIMTIVRGGGYMVRNISAIKRDIRQEACYVVCLYMLVLGVGCAVVSMYGYDLTTVVTAVSSTLSNTGIGVGNIVGPNGNMSGLLPSTKVILVSIMLLGRLEIVPVVVALVTVLRIGFFQMKGIWCKCENT
ncbi:TrkH family potassium uptake protein [Candidatus Anaplasma sp. TIGMIC]|uniref:TrkH family potassium uptake protein n=1 Tax=Candidatus Anaplasma sp. TIGMIC TaxID=3020713 RepID=UPI00232EDE65|nr:TrkH family potassium uptake protein [Candidatus Anaplasma sp. TIGMIC]MDB1135300.1 TrkH family potassium uptake protein [Candidatus Anaplasma sp. TIGMIC]